MTETFSVSITTKTDLRKSIASRSVFKKIKEIILGKKYELSLVFIDSKEAKRLNKQYRNKTYTPNVLSFPLTKNSGEIFIDPITAKKEALKFGRNEKNHVTALFIHALLHLKGYRHGSRMEKAEQKVRTNFNI